MSNWDEIMTTAITMNSQRGSIGQGSRSRILATSFFRQLKDSGVSQREILSISSYLIEFLTEDFKLKGEETVHRGATTNRESQIPK
jgi:hypothetical protein